MARSLFLTDNWDIALNDNGGLSTAEDAYAVAQNVASAVRLFTNDAYFDTDAGIPHFEVTFKRNPDVSIIRSRIKTAAEAVAGVRSARVELRQVSSACVLQGTIFLTLTNGENAEVEL